MAYFSSRLDDRRVFCDPCGVRTLPGSMDGGVWWQDFPWCWTPLWSHLHDERCVACGLDVDSDAARGITPAMRELKERMRVKVREACGG